MVYQIKGGFYEEIQKSKVFFEIGIESKTQEKMKKSTWKAIIKEKSEERMNREIQQKYNHEDIDISEGCTCK